MNDPQVDTDAPSTPQPLSARQRRILGSLIEKARTTPDSYPLSLNGLVTACNQKSNRFPLMQLTHEEVEDELETMRETGLVAEVHGGGRVAKYRHYAYDYLGVKGVQAAVITELLLRGEQTVGDLRSRASRFEPIADLKTLSEILDELENRGLVVSLTPSGRGQMVTHNLYFPDELEQIRESMAGAPPTTPSRTRSPVASNPGSDVVADLTQEIDSLKKELAELRARVERLEN